MKIAIVSGKSEGPTELNAFDNALMDAGIGDVNWIKVSSMLGANTEIIDLPKLKAGSMVNCVLSTINSKNKGDTITACIAIAIGDNLGCVVENAGINISNEENRKDALEMVKYMMHKRNEKINQMIIEDSTHTVENIGSVVASVVYINEWL